ncbi:MAG: 50S ribosomal protein L4 [Candidatus Binatia bacterium]
MAEPITVSVKSQQNAVVGEMTLPPAVFAQPVRRHLLYEVVRMQQANRRAGTSATKTRGMVSGGGKKPWRQKGTGRARAGSSRSPVWRGGAVVFGPRPRDYAYRLPASARKAAICSALAAKVREGKLIVVDQIVLNAPKTKVLVQLLRELQVDNALIMTQGRDDSLERAARNLPLIKVLRTEGANVYDLLRYDRLILTQAAVSALTERLGA